MGWKTIATSMVLSLIAVGIAARVPQLKAIVYGA
jgi:hypothetical protein